MPKVKILIMYFKIIIIHCWIIMRKCIHHIIMLQMVKLELVYCLYKP